ncbi:hypothetical protein Tco_1137928, partial [Tanacetum coccineum]
MERNSSTKLCRNIMKMLAYFIKNLFRVLLNKMALSKDEINRSLIHTRHNKTPYELVHDKKPDLTFLRVFGALCYPTNDSEDLVTRVDAPVPSATAANAYVVPP